MNFLFLTCFQGLNNQIPQALEIIEEMKQMDLNPDIFVFTSLLKGYFQEKDPKKWEENLQKVNDILQKDLKLYNIVPDKVMYIIIFQGLCSFGKFSECLQKLNEMQDCGMYLTVEIFNSVIDGFCKNGKFAEAMHMAFSEMKERQIRPNLETYTFLIRELCKIPKMEQAELLFDRMKKNHLVPNVYLFTMLISGYCKTQQFDKALTVLDDMGKHNVHPNIVTFNTFLESFCKANMMEESEEMIQVMTTKLNIAPNLQTVNYVLEAYCRLEDTENAKLFFNKIFAKYSKEFFPSFAMHVMLFDCYCRNEKFEYAWDILQSMDKFFQKIVIPAPSSSTPEHFSKFVPNIQLLIHHYYFTQENDQILTDIASFVQKHKITISFAWIEKLKQKNIFL